MKTSREQQFFHVVKQEEEWKDESKLRVQFRMERTLVKD